MALLLSENSLSFKKEEKEKLYTQWPCPILSPGFYTGNAHKHKHIGMPTQRRRRRASHTALMLHALIEHMIASGVSDGRKGGYRILEYIDISLSYVPKYTVKNTTMSPSSDFLSSQSRASKRCLSIEVNLHRQT